MLSVYLKNETVLPTGSFKVRGATHALRAALDRGQMGEVVAASTGNHGAAVAWAARLSGVPARIFVPENSNPVKLARIRAEGAALIETGRDLTAAITAAGQYARATGAFFLHDASSPDVPMGTATIGAELVEDVPALHTNGWVYIPMGDTALIRGVATALRLLTRSIGIIGVVAERAPAYMLSWKIGAVVETADAPTVADGLAVRQPLPANVQALRDLLTDVVAVSEDEMLETIGRLHRVTGIVSEPSGAAALAALLRDAPRRSDGAPQTAAAIVTGANLSPEVAARAGLGPSSSGVERADHG